MLTLTLRGLWAHKLRFALTGLAVVLGVAFMAGTMILTDTISTTFNGLLQRTNAGVDVVVQQPTAAESDLATVRERVDASALDTVRATDGVAAAAGSIQGFAQLVDGNGEARISDGLEQTIGINWIADEALNPFTIDAGHAPHGAGEVVIDRASAEREGFALGDTLSVLAKGRPRRLTLVGTAGYGEVDGLPGTTVVAVDDATAQALFAEPGTYDQLLVASDGSRANGELADELGTRLGGRYEVLTGEENTADQQASFEEDLSFFNSFLMAFAWIALFVGSFIIYNTFSIVVAQRSREMAMLRAVGASRRQVLRSVLVESIGVGMIASAVGLALGVALSFGLRALLGAVGVEIPAGPVVISSGTVTTSFVVGVAVSVLSAIGPALRASRVAPIAALREVSLDEAASSLRRTIAGLLVAGLGAVAFAGGVTAGGEDGLPLVGLGALLAMVGLFVLGPVIARPAAHLLAAPAVAVDGTTGRLARENAARNPKRTSATASALMVGVALVGLITILATSTKDSLSEVVDSSLHADYVLDSGAWGEGGFSPDLGHDVAALPGVAAVSPLRSSPFEVAGASADLFAMDTATLGRLLDLGVSAGDLADVHGDAVAVKAGTTVDGHELALGDSVTVRFPRTGERRLTVSAVYDDDIVGAGATRWLVGLDTFEANVSDQFDRQLFVAVADGADPAVVGDELDRLLEAWPNAELQDPDGFRDGLTGQVDKMLNLIYGLLALAVVIALIGIANTLALSVHERRREIGLLRAVGMTQRQVRRSVRWESVAIALLGTTLGLAVAVAGAWGIVTALGDEVRVFTIPLLPLAVIAGFGGLAGVLAARGPARRAARLDVLDAIATA